MLALREHGYDIGVVVTNPDRRRGRGGAVTPNPVKMLAQSFGVAIVNSPAEALEYECDLGIVVAYGRLIRPNVLDQLPMVNVHFSLLPRWRGAAPVERAILAGDEKTGVCVMGLEEGLDTGPVFAKASTPIDPNEDVDQLRDRLALLGTQLLLDQLSLGDRAWSAPIAQQGEVTYAEKITIEDLHLDLSRSADEVHRVVRVGRAWTTFRGRRLLIHAAQTISEAPPGMTGEIVDDVVVTGNGGLQLLVVQTEGKSRVDAKTWLRGVRPVDGERLGLERSC